MVCFRNDLKVHTQELKLGSNEAEDGEFATTLRKEELLNRDNCTWLSISGESSPSSCSKDSGSSGYMDLKIDAWLISLLSAQSSRSDTVLNTKVTFFDGSRVNPIEEASLVLDQSKKLDENMVFQENLEEEEVVLWLKNESSDCGSECYSQTLDKRSKSMSKLPYFTDSSDEQSLFSSSSSSDYSSEVMDLEEISTDKPLFWPFNSASDWCSETKWDSFIMSPCKDICKVSISPKTSYNREPNSPKGCNRRLVFETRLQSSDNLRNKDGMNDNNSCLDTHGNMDLEKGCNRRLEFSTDSKSSSNMTRSANIAATDQAEVDCLTTRSGSKHKIVLEDLMLVDKLNAEGVIEQVLGLGEFDGHEGIESEYNKDEFSLWF